jgi:hypothetical protein
MKGESPRLGLVLAVGIALAVWLAAFALGLVL